MRKNFAKGTYYGIVGEVRLFCSFFDCFTLRKASTFTIMRNKSQDILIKDFQYYLPHERIAEFPLPQRDQSRLLVYKSGKIEDDHFYQLPNHLHTGSCLILNNTRVIEARLHFQKPTGGVIEIFCLEPAGENDIAKAIMQTGLVRWNCLIGGASKWKPGQILQKEIHDQNRHAVLSARYIEKLADSFIIEFCWEPGDWSFGEVLHAAGAIPLPPYIKRKPQEEDASRYQTVFATHEGSVAAPTASLHFTETTFKNLAEKGIQPHYVTLHVGAGTFKPVKSETIAEHQMHAEHFHVSLATLQALMEAREIIAAGTTSLRTLESLYWIGVKLIAQPTLMAEELSLEQWEAYELPDNNLSYRESLQAIIHYLHIQHLTEVYCRTSLIIVPGYQFRTASAIITNFHLPQSTLLLLIAAFIGDDWKTVYQHALDNGYRFLSYGDSSLLWRKQTGEPNYGE